MCLPPIFLYKSKRIQIRKEFKNNDNKGND